MRRLDQKSSKVSLTALDAWDSIWRLGRPPRSYVDWEFQDAFVAACNSVTRLELGPLSRWSVPSSPFRWSGLHLPTPSPWGLLLVPPHIPMALGAAARPESPVPAHYHCSHLHCNPTPAFQRAAPTTHCGQCPGSETGPKQGPVFSDSSQ